MAAQGSVKDARPQVEQQHACRMRVVSYLHGYAAQRLLRRSSVQPSGLSGLGGCGNPLLACCDGCGALRVWACASHRESRCKPCSARYRRRVFRVADAGLSAGARRGRRLYLLTLTAPSQGPHRRWVPGEKGVHGDCDCWVEDLAAWNGSQAKCWNRLRTWLTREYPSLRYFRAVEVQDRGALHLHVLLVLDESVSIQAVQAAALASGFGCVIDLEPLTPGSPKAARYVSKYVTKACDTRESVPWYDERLDRWTGEILERTEAAYRTWSSSQSWDLTMRECVAAARRAVNLRELETRCLGEGEQAPASRAAGASREHRTGAGSPVQPPDS